MTGRIRRAQAVGAAALLLAACLAATPTLAYDLGEGAEVGLHLRTRFDRHDGRDGNSANVPFEAFENRTRISLDLEFVEELRAFVQVQDVRIWGEEKHPVLDFTANGLGLHQAFGEVRLLEGKLALRIGRQEITLDEQRLVGNVGWTPQARSHNAIRLMARSSCECFHIGAFYSVLSDADDIHGADRDAEGNRVYPANLNTRNSFLAGVHASYQIFKDDSGEQYISFTGLYDQLDHFDAGQADQRRYTLGLYNRGQHSFFVYAVEGYYQGGKTSDADISAWLLHARAGVTFPDLAGLTFLGWFDLLSGDADTKNNTIQSFDPAFATNHKYYGMADFFISFPANTGKRGLIDVAAKFSVKPADGLKILLHYHHFMPAREQPGLDGMDFGNEIDFVASYQVLKGFKIALELFVMLPGDDLAKARPLAGTDPDLGLYVTTQIEL